MGPKSELDGRCIATGNEEAAQCATPEEFKSRLLVRLRL